MVVDQPRRINLQGYEGSPDGRTGGGGGNSVIYRSKELVADMWNDMIAPSHCFVDEYFPGAINPALRTRMVHKIKQDQSASLTGG